MLKSPNFILLSSTSPTHTITSTATTTSSVSTALSKSLSRLTAGSSQQQRIQQQHAQVYDTHSALVIPIKYYRYMVSNICIYDMIWYD